MVCWSVIAMLKEKLFLVLALSALAVLAALKLHKKCCSTRKQEDLESNHEENNQAEGQPLIEQPGAGGQENIELEVKLEPPAGKGGNQTEVSTDMRAEKELAEGSKDNKRGIEINLEDNKEKISDKSSSIVTVNKSTSKVEDPLMKEPSKKAPLIIQF